MSPEQLDGKLSFKTDIWAYGCTLLQYITGLRPFNDIDEEIAACHSIMVEQVSPLDYALANNPG